MAPVTSESKQATSDPEAHRLPPTSDLMAETSVVSSSLDEVDNYLAPDGGYGWVIVACILGINIVTYGINTSYGVYIAYYLEHNYFDGATYMTYAFVGGLSVGIAWFCAPGQCLSGLTQHLAMFVVWQGLIFGMGLGLTSLPPQQLLPQWFDKRLSLAQGIATTGSGIGGLIFSNTTRAALATMGVKYTLIMNGCISAVVLVPCLVLLKGRTAVNVRVEPLQVKWFVHSTFFWVWTWGFFAAMAYFIAIYSLAPYATDGIGLSQTQGAALQSILAGGQIIGRPLIGLALDKGGRFNMTIIANIVAGLSCVAIWMPARSFAALVPYAILQGVVGGTVFSVVVPVTTSAVGVLDMGSAFAMFGLSIVPATTFGQAIAVSLINFSKDTLLKSGGDVYQISIGLCGGFFWVSALLLFGGKVALQGNMKLLKKT
uniref:Major facilitator superfamily (MFS) profile domain-containing protein n=1 Tax=Bionectria ochroleuca TaxID=29856 RepID=A0A8H7NE26_BIOOC